MELITESYIVKFMLDQKVLLCMILLTTNLTITMTFSNIPTPILWSRSTSILLWLFMDLNMDHIQLMTWKYEPLSSRSTSCANRWCIIYNTKKNFELKNKKWQSKKQNKTKPYSQLKCSKITIQKTLCDNYW